MRLHSVLAASALLLLFSCSKDKSGEGPDNSGDQTTYQPVAAGSAWHYHDNLDTDGGFTLTATGRDTTIDGIPLYVFDNKPDTSSVIIKTCIGQDQINYYARGLISSLKDVTFLFLKDTTVNSTWTQTVAYTLPAPLGTVSAEMDFKLKKTNTTKAVSNKTYKQVAEVALEINIPIPGTPNSTFTYATGDFYFARGVGLIAMTIKLNGSAVSDISLDSYTVK